MSIEELGSVNVNAIEQFEEINERYTFLNEQRNDLREAKQTLEQIIDEMDQEVKDRFKATFLKYKIISQLSFNHFWWWSCQVRAYG